MPSLRCFSSLGCPDASLDETFALAAKRGIPAVELRALGGSMDLPGYFTTQFGAPTRLAAHARTSPVRIVALDASLHLAGATAEERAGLEALAPWAEALGVRWLRVFDGNGRGEDDGARQAQGGAGMSAAETLGWWRELRRARGWRAELMVETHDALLTGATIAAFVAEFPGTSILWDAHHTWRKGGEDPVATWRRIRAHVVHVHVKDSVAVPSARHPFTYVLPGDGDFPMAPLCAVLEADGFAGPISLEWERAWHPYLPSLDAALAVAAGRAWW